MNDWLEPVFLLYLGYSAAIFALGNAYGQDKVRLAYKRKANEQPDAKT